MRKYALILLILIGSIALLNAATTGKLAVRVRDGSGRAIEFVNVSVMQNNRTLTGGRTNNKGTAIIINIPPGFYTVKFTLVGYDDYIVNQVRIQVDQTTSLSPVMNKKGVVLSTVTVTAEPDRVERDRVGSATQIDMTNMADVAVTDVAGVVAMQAGVTNIGGELHVRGGRSNEVNFTVDGMSVSDPVDGGSALGVDLDAIKDMKVMTGGFPAEYGNAQSGVINIVTKDGDPFYSGKVEYNTDHIIGSGRNMDVIKFAIGGPVIPFGSEDLKERFTFYLNAGGEWQDGRLKDYWIGDPMKDYLFGNTQLLEYEYDAYNPYDKRKSFAGIDFGNRNYNGYNANLKAKYVFSPTQNMTFAVRGDRNYNYGYSYGWRYALHHYWVQEINQRQYIGTYDHVLNNQMNFKLKASYYQKTSNSGPRGIDRGNYLFQQPYQDSQYVDNALMGEYGYDSVDNDGDGVFDFGFLPSYFWTYRIAGLEAPRSISGFMAPGSIFDNFVDDVTSTVNLRGDFEYQINETHLAKTGLELIKHNIKKDQMQNFLTVYEDRRQASLNRVFNEADLANWTPQYEYITDENGDQVIKLRELDGHPVILNIPDGLYYVYITEDEKMIPIYHSDDYFRAAKEASGKRDGYQADPWQIAYYIQDKMEWEGMIVNAGLRLDFWYLGTSYKVLEDNGVYRSVDFDSKDRFQAMISPRLGVSHPITERDVLRFAYNYQNQLPQMQYIFTSKTPEDANISDTVITVGNPTLEPQITVTYEVGLSHQLSDDYVLDATAYYKNLYNYVSTVKEKKPGEEQISWYKFISEDYGSTRGIDLQLEKLLSNFYTWNVAYSLAWANGNNSSTVIQDEMTNLREFPLDWDIRHNLNTSFTFRIGRGEEFFVPFTDFILPLDDFSANLNWSFASGAPYTPQSIDGNNMLDTNSMRMRWTNQANLRLTKGFVLPGNMSVRAFMDVENIFKKTNILSVYPKTGSPYETGEDISDTVTGFTYPEVAYVYNKAISNPSMVNNHRGVTFGVSFNF
ncbi:MAG: carboxypeptidase regulatory-like domain-containing protein [Candidatus Cloacimonetes bacterium]|nr:carboxypeptidase regulatory-like domain-containing protein [Candidatus Cloacimonadota bacterium]